MTACAPPPLLWQSMQAKVVRAIARGEPFKCSGSALEEKKSFVLQESVIDYHMLVYTTAS